jgi:peptide/nickel transport system substrate-binding protein
MKKAIALFTFLAIALAAFAVRSESVLRVREVDDLKGFDPIYTSDYMVREHGYLVYDTLFAADENFNARPQMVDSVEVSADKLTWTLHLRPGLAFSDGQKVTAADVVASIKRWSERDGFGQMLAARTAKLEETDPATLRIVLKQPWGLVADALGKPSSNVPFIMPARIAATPPDKQISEPIGSGPFIMRGDLWVHGAKIVYERNRNYVPRSDPANGLAGGKRALVDRVELVILPDPATAAAALQKGEIDLFDGVPPDLAPALVHAKGVKLMPADSVGQLLILRPNSIQPPFDDPKMRQALRYAIDQTQFRDLYSTDPSLTRTCESFLACTSPYSTNVGWTKPDLEKARALVKEGHYDGRPVVVLDVADYFTHPHALLVGQMLKEIGINADVQGMDSTTWVARRARREGWNLAVVAPSGIDAGDPLSMFALRANCDKAWYGWPCDEALEKVRTQYADATDVTARKEMVEKIQLRALEVGPYWPLGMIFGIRGYREEFSGFPKTPVPVYWNIERH